VQGSSFPDIIDRKRKVPMDHDVSRFQLELPFDPPAGYQGCCSKMMKFEEESDIGLFSDDIDDPDRYLSVEFNRGGLVVSLNSDNRAERKLVTVDFDFCPWCAKKLVEDEEDE